MCGFKPRVSASAPFLAYPIARPKRKKIAVAEEFFFKNGIDFGTYNIVLFKVVSSDLLCSLFGPG